MFLVSTFNKVIEWLDRLWPPVDEEPVRKPQFPVPQQLIQPMEKPMAMTKTSRDPTLGPIATM